MEQKNTQKLTVKRFDTTQTLEASEDFSLPDYIPEVRRIVGVQSNASVDGKYLNGEELEADGSVSYTVLYLGEDGCLHSVPLNTAFDGRIPVKSVEGDVFGTEDISLSVCTDNVICRVTAPRRLTLSSRVKLRMFSQRTLDCTETVSEPELSNTVRLKKEQADYASVKTVRGNIECGGELREREGTKVIFASGTLHIADVKPADGGIAVAGEARISLLLLTPDGVYTTAKGRCAADTVLPFDTSTLITAAAWGRCLLCEIQTAEDGLITWNMECDIDCDAVTGGHGEISTDGYCTDHTYECTFAEASALTPLRCINGRLSVSGTKSIRPGMTYAGGYGRASFDKGEQIGGKLVLTGNAVLTAILCGEGEAVTEEVTVPVKYECDGNPAAGENVVGTCEFAVCDTSGRCDGDTLNVTGEISVGGVFLGEKKTTYLSAISPNPESPVVKRRNVITICIPDEGESEWDIMKRYRVAQGTPKRSGRVVLIP